MNTFARDMRAIRRARASHWQRERGQCQQDQFEIDVQALYARALGIYLADALPSTVDGQQQNWDFALTASIDAHDDIIDPRVRAFIAACPLPDVKKSSSRLKRRVLLEWRKTTKTTKTMVRQDPKAQGAQARAT